MVSTAKKMAIVPPAASAGGGVGDPPGSRLGNLRITPPEAHAWGQGNETSGQEDLSIYSLLRLEQAEARKVQGRLGEDDCPGFYERLTKCLTPKSTNVSLLEVSPSGKLRPRKLDVCDNRLCAFCGFKKAIKEADTLERSMRAYINTKGGSLYYVVLTKRDVPTGLRDDWKGNFRASAIFSQLIQRELRKKFNELAKYGMVHAVRATEGTMSYKRGRVGGTYHVHQNLLFFMRPGLTDDEIEEFKDKLISLNTQAMQRAFNRLEPLCPAYAAALKGKSLWDPSENGSGFSISRVDEEQIGTYSKYIAKGSGGSGSISLEIVNGQAKRSKTGKSFGSTQLLRLWQDQTQKKWVRNWALEARQLWIAIHDELQPRAFSYTKTNGKNFTVKLIGKELENIAAEKLKNPPRVTHCDIRRPKPGHPDFIGVDDVDSVLLADLSAGDWIDKDVGRHKPVSESLGRSLAEAEDKAWAVEHAGMLVGRGYIFSDYVLEHYFGGDVEKRTAHILQNWERFEDEMGEKPVLKPKLKVPVKEEGEADGFWMQYPCDEELHLDEYSSDDTPLYQLEYCQELALRRRELEAVKKKVA